MNGTIRVLVLCEFPSLNGGERSLLAALSNIDRASITIMIAAPPHGEFADLLADTAFEYVPFRFRDESGTRRPTRELESELTDVIQERRIQLVHCNSLSTSRLGGPVCRELGVPSIGHLRDIMKVSARAIQHLDCHNRILAVSDATREWYISAGLQPENIVVEYNGVDIDRFQPRTSTGFLHTELHLPPTAVLIGSVGQIGMRKGLDVLIRAAASITTQRNDVHFVIVGQRYSQKEEARQFEDELHSAAGSVSLRGHVHFLGVRSDVHHLMDEWTMLVHAARQEPLGRVLLEAAASGLPIVATRVGGTTEIFPPNTKTADLVTAGSSNELADAILRLLENSERRSQLGRAARGRAVRFFDAKVVGSRLANHYDQVAQPKQP